MFSSRRMTHQGSYAWERKSAAVVRNLHFFPLLVFSVTLGQTYHSLGGIEERLTGRKGTQKIVSGYIICDDFYKFHMQSRKLPH